MVFEDIAAASHRHPLRSLQTGTLILALDGHEVSAAIQAVDVTWSTVVTSTPYVQLSLDATTVYARALDGFAGGIVDYRVIEYAPPMVKAPTLPAHLAVSRGL